MQNVVTLSCLLALLTLTVTSKKLPFMIRPHYGDSRCEKDLTPGDCNVQHCIESGLGEACESRYVRFMRSDGKDYSRKTCRCLTEPLCAIMPSNKQGCVTYSQLNHQAQRVIRKWTMSESDRESITLHRAQYHDEYKLQKPLRLRFKHSNLTRYTETKRHNELIKGKTRFCCRLHRPIYKRAQHLTSREPYQPSSGYSTAISLLPLISIFYFV